MSSDYVAQREALVDLSVAYEGARDFTRQVLCTAFGNVALGSVPPPSECVWPPDITQAEANSRLRAVRHFLAKTEAVFKKVLRDIDVALDRLVASGFDVPRSWIITDPLYSIRGWYLGACGVEEIVRNATSEDSALQTVVKEISIDVRKLKGEIAKADQATSKTKTPTKAKRSTERGEGRVKLIAALTKHHKYADGSCLNFEPVNSNELARLAKVAPATANSFFNNWFGSAKEAKDGYSNYRVACNDEGKLIAILKVMNDEQPRPGEVLFGRKVPDEAENPDHRGDRRRKPRASEQHSDDVD